MMRVETATARDFEQVYPLLQQFNASNPNISKAQWRLLFDYPWPTKEAQRGLVLRDDAVGVVGFIATIFSERRIAGQTVPCCNLSSWITLPEYRHQSLLLLRAAFQRSDCTITCMTPTKATYPFYIRCGFKDLETGLKVLYPIPAWRRARGWFSCQVTTAPGRLARELGGADALILEHHRQLLCWHLLVTCAAGSCYVVFSKVPGRRVDFAHLHYISDRQIFLEHLDRIRLRMFLASGTPFLLLDARMAAGMDIPHCKEVSLSRPHVFRSPTLQREQIDHLYSELMLLNL